jgi:hypothetical protein
VRTFKVPHLEVRGVGPAEVVGLSRPRSQVRTYSLYQEVEMYTRAQSTCAYERLHAGSAGA